MNSPKQYLIEYFYKELKEGMRMAKHQFSLGPSKNSQKFDRDIEEVVQFAAHVHHGQKYGSLPYTVHLKQVHDVLAEFGITNPELLAAAWLHDTLEDTESNYHDLLKEFGRVVADVVYDMTDELGHNRKERKIKTWPKMASNYRSVIVKQADMIANGRRGKKMGNDKYQMYKKEYPAFREYFESRTLGAICLWEELDKLFEYRTAA